MTKRGRGQVSLLGEYSVDKSMVYYSILISSIAIYPEWLWGLSLGQRLKDIRVKGAYLNGSSGPARRAQLDALGFNWAPKRGRKKKSPPAEAQNM